MSLPSDPARVRIKACADCSAPITRHSTRCKPCAMRMVGKRPDVVVKFVAGVRAKFADPAHRAKMQGVAARARDIRIEKQLGWCPRDRREEWLRFSRSMSARRLPLDQRRQAFLTKIRAERANLSPFERQEMALRNGAKLIANQRIYR